MSKREDQKLLQILQELEHTEFIYILADICQIRGWNTYLNIGNPNNDIDLVANQIFPQPQSIAVIYYNQGKLTSETVREYSKDSDEDKITIIAKNHPSEEALEISSKADIDVISLRDIVQEIILNSGEEVIKSNVNKNSRLREEYSGFFEQTLQDDQSDDNNSKPRYIGIIPREDNSNQTDSGQELDDHYYKDKYIGIKVTGAKYYEGTNTMDSGYIFSLAVRSTGLRMKYWGKYLSGIDSEGNTYSTASNLIEFKTLAEMDRLSSWSLRGDDGWPTSVPQSGDIKTLAVIHCPENTEFSKLEYDADYPWCIQEEDEVVSKFSSDSDSIGKIQIELDNWSELLDQGLPEKVDKSLKSVGY